MRLLAAASVLLVGHTLYAQGNELAKAPRLEVVSIKQAAVPDEVLPRLLTLGGGCGLPGLERSGSHIRVVAASLCGLIRIAYDVADHQVVGVPPSLAKGEASNLFEIDARVEGTNTPTLDEARILLRTVLAERFLLRIHREAIEMPVYALVVAEGGPKQATCSRSDAPSTYSPGQIISCRPPMPMTRIAQFLTREAGRPVIDKTGLAETYAFELHWLPENAQPQPDSPPPLFTAIQEQLGLRLTPQRVGVDSIVVDHAERPSPN